MDGAGTASGTVDAQGAVGPRRQRVGVRCDPRRHEGGLKVINTTKVEREPYQRFVREIGFLREHQEVAGCCRSSTRTSPTNHRSRAGLGSRCLRDTDC